MTSKHSLMIPFLAALLLLSTAGTAPAKTITLTSDECDQMAILDSHAPRSSWAGIHYGNGIFDIATQIQMKPGMAILAKFPFDKIPKDQRILKAELTMNAQYVAGAPRLQVRRILADWGTGVCHQYARAYPKKVEWSQPGGRGAADRNPKDTSILVFKVVGDVTAEVTEDVDLWYTGGAANRGWIFTLENDAGVIYLSSPYSPHIPTAKWKLQITYEPK